ncbi:MAG: helix-turn-helix domain-containing protein [Lachnospiraceae bacterium]
MTLYEKVTALREKLGISQSELERKANLSKGTITNWKNRNPNMTSIEKVANALGCDVSYFLSDEEKQGYYINEETAAMAQKIFENKDLRTLFDAAQDATPEDLQTVHSMLLALKRKERGNIDD